MKRWFFIILAILLLVPSIAYADVIIEPENGFFRKHREECSHIGGRTYLANGSDGSLTLYSSPGSAGAKDIPNGEAFYCEWVYTDKEGTVWGFSQRHELWAPLGLTLVQYDDTSFRSEFRDKIIQNNGLSVEGKPLAMYAYPGAPDPFLLDVGEGFTPSDLYIDENGLTWGSVGYYYGVRDKWVCLDDPSNENLQGEAKAPVSSGFAAPRSLPSGSGIGIILYAVGGVAVITTAIVLVLFRRKKTAS